MQDLKHYVREVLSDNARQVKIYQEDARQSAKRLNTGIKTVRVGSYQNGDPYELTIPRKAITTICAKSGGGKTTDMLNIAFALRENGYRGIYITYEEPACDLFSKTMSLFTRKLKECDEPQEFFECKQQLAAGFESWKWSEKFKKFMGNDGLRFIDGTKQKPSDDPVQPTLLQDPRALNEAMICAKEMGENLDFIILDYVQLMDAGNGFESTSRNMKEVMQALRSLVGNYSAAVIIGAQMNREAAKIPFNQWIKEQISDGSEIEKSSNMIIALCVKNASTKENPRYMMGLRVLKNRGGPVQLQSLHEVEFEYTYIDKEGNHDPDALG